jgi:large subunit ribosomal protein L4
MKIKFIDSKFKVSDKNFDSKLFDLDFNKIALAKYIRVYLSNKRQGTAKTKDRSEVRGGGRKPWRQKGTGRARHGSIRSPIWTGGGVTFGPTGDQNHKLNINKKEKLIATYTLLKYKVKNDLLSVAKLEKVKKTKDAQEILEKLDLDGKILVVTNNEDIIRSFRNIEKVSTKTTHDLSTFDLYKVKNVVFGEDEFDKYLEVKNNQLSK